ncbi:hypothetical protein DFH06DRAFT_1471334 [Mycena polygramma]|nr:hypothetical protein DFH06DRAFT_1471334 [Mycena polygramma]
MFFPASIALASILSFSYTAVNSAPVAIRETTQTFCTLPNGGGTCTPIKASGVCTNTPNMQSLVLNQDADCAAFTAPDCDGTQPFSAFEEFSDDSQDLADKGFQSVRCFNNVGSVNGIAKGSAEDVEQEAADEAAGVLVPA